MSALRARARGERGVAAVEFALFLPLIALVVFASLPLLERMTITTDLHRAAWEGMRYGVKVRPNPVDNDPAFACSAATGRITRRHTVDEIVAETRRAASHLLGDPDGVAPLPASTSVVVEIDGTPHTTGPATCTVQASIPVRVVVSVTRPAGPAAGVANGVAGLFGNDDGIFADPYTVTVDAVGILE